MPLFVLHRDHTHRSLLGRSIAFKKGVDTHVPPEMVKEVVAIGAVLADGSYADVIDPEKVVASVPVGTEREELICAAFDELIATNTRSDFTGNGMPSLKALQRTLGFEVDRREIDKLWHERGNKAVAA